MLDMSDIKKITHESGTLASQMLTYDIDLLAVIGLYQAPVGSDEATIES